MAGLGDDVQSRREVNDGISGAESADQLYLAPAYPRSKSATSPRTRARARIRSIPRAATAWSAFGYYDNVNALGQSWPTPRSSTSRTTWPLQA